MAVLCWMAGTLALLLSAGNSLAAVDQNQLATIVTQILNRYTPEHGDRTPPMFSLAVSIPKKSGSETYDIGQVTDDGGNVRTTILRCEVYTSPRMVAATVLRWPNVVIQCPNEPVQWPINRRLCQRYVRTWADVQRECPDVFREGRADHAEYRILQKFNTLVNNRDENDLLLFYVRASPCDQRCTNEEHNLNILNDIQKIQNWNNYAVVFSDVFRPRNGPPIPEVNLRGALERLGQSVGLNNIFRCHKTNGQMQCTSCSTGGGVTRKCLSDEP